MPHIETLIPDVYKLLENKVWPDDILEEFGDEVGEEIKKKLKSKFSEDTETPALRLSKMGPRCPCSLWHSIHTPGEAEALPPQARFKYLYGDVIEILAIALAKAAGHTVEGEQDEISVDDIRGHRDCVIDGCVVDVKSATSRGVEDVKKKNVAFLDDWGYLSQLDGYLLGSRDDPIVKVKDKAYLWFIDKQLGHMVLHEHTLREASIRNRIKEFKSIVAQSVAPRCLCGTIADGESGNIKLDVKASYNPFKYCCHPNLRTFLYSDGPRYLTRVVKHPKNKWGPIPEIDRKGNIVYTNV